MHGTSPQPVLTDAPREQQPEDPPQPRYYTARSRRRAVTGIGVAALIGIGMGAILLRTGVIGRSDDGTVRPGTEAGPLDPAGMPSAQPAEPPRETPPDPERGPFVPAEAEIDIDSVAMVGDSITEASADAITFTLKANGVSTVEIDGVARRRIEVGGNGGGDVPTSGISAVYSLLASGIDADVWVIALGTNDVGAYAEEAQYGELVDSILEMIPADARLVWVDVYRPRQGEYAAMFNEVLADRLEDRGNAVVASWSDVVSHDETLLRDDRIHPNADGSAAFAKVVLDGIAALDD